jgi:hypothetical protein
MNKPNPDRNKALWELDCATNLNPTFLEAIKMKERLTGSELSSVDNSTTRGFLKRMIMADREKHAEAEACKPAILLTAPARSSAANNQDPAPTASVAEPSSAVPTTQPALAAAPTTQPANQASAARPTTQPAVANSKPAPTPSELLDEDEDEDLDDSGVAVQPREQAVPAQKPADGADNVKKSTVTEVPQDELPGTDEQGPQDEK